MEILKHFLEFLHFLGFSGLIGGALAQIRVPEKTVTRIMIDGAWTQLATGLLLVLNQLFNKQRWRLKDIT